MTTCEDAHSRPNLIKKHKIDENILKLLYKDIGDLLQNLEPDKVRGFKVTAINFVGMAAMGLADKRHPARVQV